jgi:carbonic anhydrase
MLRGAMFKIGHFGYPRIMDADSFYDGAMTNISRLFLLLAFFSSTCGASLCESGLRQSPIDIRTSKKQNLPELGFSYRSAPLRLANDGHTVRVRFMDAGKLTIGRQNYALQQFHVHTPGGDRIAGEEFPMAAHILHKSASGQLLAIVVPFRLGAENPLLNRVFGHIPLPNDGDHVLETEHISAMGLLPKDLGYFRYSGSLTASPCTEGVEWIVMKQPQELSAAQLALYKRKFADNIRSPRALNQRVVLESQ